MARFRPLHLTKKALRVLLRAIAALLLLIVIAIVAIETGWVKNQIRRLIVRQANNYLTATLDIGRLEGSVFRGLKLGDVRVVQNGQTIISVDEVSLSYSIRELFEPGLIIRSIRLTRPRVVAAKLANGKWNVGVLLKREAHEQQRAGPGRPLHILAIEVADGDVELKDPLTVGAVHIPTRYAHLNAALTLDYVPVTWSVQMQRVAWTGDAENITMERLVGGLSNGASGWEFQNLSARTTGSDFVVNGRVNRGDQPTSLDLRARATRFSFQEWSSVIPGLRNIAVESSFSLSLQGPPHKLVTSIDLKSESGDINAALALDTGVPGWHGKGQAAVAHFDLSHWLNRADRPSDITGDATFDLDLDLGRHFPRGSYAFRGPHVSYLGYAISNFAARGTLTPADALIDDATGTAYGSALHITNGSIGIDAPYTYRFQGADAGLDLRMLPPQVPITHVESRIALDWFDVDGQFEASPFIRGDAEFGPSEYLGAAIGAGTTGWIDTSVSPVQYAGDGDIRSLDVARFGDGLDVQWMKDPRWAGTLAGHFRVDGAGPESGSMRIDGGGHLSRADMFDGQLSDADVSLHIAGGSLTGTYDGRLAHVDTAKAFADESFAGTITGQARATFAVRDLMVRTTTIDDYKVEGSLEAEQSTVRGLSIYHGSIAGALDGSTLRIASLRMSGPIDMTGSGLLEFDGERSSDFQYQIGSADLALASQTTGHDLHGTMTANGSLTGPLTAMHLLGEASLDNVEVGGTTVLSTIADYDITTSWENPSAATGRVTGSVTEMYAFDHEIPSVTGTLTYDNEQVTADLKIQADWDSRSILSSISLTGAGRFQPRANALDLSRLTLIVSGYPSWQFSGATPAHIAWSDAGLTVAGFELSDAASHTQHASINGSWRFDGTGQLQLTAKQISLDALTATGGAPARYGGSLDVDATLGGTRERPTIAATVRIDDGRVRKLAYQQLQGTVSYVSGEATVDLRLDQGPGVWLSAKGAFPVPSAGAGDRPIELSIASSTIGLGLLEGITDVVSNVSGQAAINVNITGTASEPRYTGNIALANAAFLVNASGAQYKNGRADLRLASDRINVTDFHLEDRNRRTIDVTGSLGTRERGVGDIQMQVTTKRFEILHDRTGSVDVGANLTVSGDLEAPKVTGDIAILAGELKVDEIFERALFQPYATEANLAPLPGAPEAAEPVDAIAALNPWDRLTLDIAVHSRGTLRMIGENVQVATGTPLGLGSFNLRATGDLYVYKDPGQPVSITGSFDSISGSYAFQGRRFDVDPTSSVVFRGDSNPELYVSVNRLIQGIQTRVTITGSLNQPALSLSSNPPLEQSDILSLIVFNQSTSDLSASQQQELAVRAGTLAYGFVATPLVSALQRSIGLETLEITPPSGAFGTTVTVGNELAPGLVAQFTREFGQEAYDEATVEYYISRILRIRATFSDAQSLNALFPFRRTERAGVDLLFFFSF